MGIFLRIGLLTRSLPHMAAGERDGGHSRRGRAARERGGGATRGEYREPAEVREAPEVRGGFISAFTGTNAVAVVEFSFDGFLKLLSEGEIRVGLRANSLNGS